MREKACSFGLNKKSDNHNNNKTHWPYDNKWINGWMDEWMNGYEKYLWDEKEKEEERLKSLKC